MCVSPVKIRNNRLDWNPMFDRFYNEVPCNHCYDCIRRKRIAIEVLLKAHFYKYQSYRPLYNDSLVNNKIGNMFYITLTYNNDNLPKYNGVPCFSHRNIQLFLKRLRKSISPFKLEYYIVSEYGGEFGRPHHHCIFFTESFYTSKTFRNLVYNAWRYGFIFGSYDKKNKIDRTIIDNVKPFGYITKYVTKDYDFVKMFGFDMPPAEYCPRVFHSNNLGLSAVRYIRGNEIHLDNKVYSIPPYISRKLFYDKYVNKNGNIGFKLNKSGLDFKLKYSSKLYSTLLESLKNLPFYIRKYDVGSILNIDNDIIINTLQSPKDTLNYVLFQRGYNKFHPIFDNYEDSLKYHFHRSDLPFMPDIKEDDIIEDDSFEFHDYIRFLIRYISKYYEYISDKDNDSTYQANLGNSSGFVKEKKEVLTFNFPYPNNTGVYNFICSFNSF